MPPADPSAAEIARLQEAARRLEQRLMLEGLSPSGVTRAQWRDPPFLNNLGAALMDAKRPDLALEAFQIAAGFQPALADIRVNQALALERLARLEEAAQVMQSAVALNPDAFGLHHRLGSLRLKLEQPQAAEAACRAAIALKPDHAPAYIGLGAALRRQDRRPEAEVAYREAIRLDPEIAMAHYNLANALQEMGRDEEAEAEYLQAMALRPDWPSARFNHGLFLLKQGRFAEGWEPYELRFHPDLTGKPERVFNTPRWNGEPLAGKTILITAEQGLGDVIQCARYVPRLAEMGAKVIIEAPAPLLGLLGRLEGVAQMIAPGSPEPAADFHCPWFSLPRGFKARLEDPTTPVYLTPAASLVAFWRARLGPGRKIGIVWQGNPAAKVERGRSFPLAALRPVADAAGAPLISLQKTHGLDQLPAAPFVVRTLGPAYDAGDFAETAAVVAGLDLVIACDTAVAHLAGALGKPVWLALKYDNDWRWQRDRSDTPWYPSARLYRQSERGRWDDMFVAMANDLAALPGQGEPT